MNKKGYFFSPLVIIILIIIGLTLSIHTAEVNSIMTSSIRESGQIQKETSLLRRDIQKRKLNARMAFYNCTRENIYDCNESTHNEIIDCIERDIDNPEILGRYNTTLYLKFDIDKITKGSVSKSGSREKVEINRNFLNVTNC